MEKKVLFLDFDGVLFDTLKEVYLVNRFIYLKTDFLENINEKEYALFSKYKYLVYNIWMFNYFNPLIFNNEKDIPNEYQKALKNRDLDKERRFCDNFLKARAQLVNNHFDFWKNLETPYDFFFEIKNIYKNEDIEIVVISKKNKNSIIDRFKTYNFNLSEDKIFAREALDNYQTKGDFIEEYVRKNNFSQGIFVDDNINNIKTNKNPKIRNILALWGNIEPNSQGYNQKEAIEEIKKLIQV